MKDGKPMEKKRGKLSLRNIFYHNTFVLVFSFAIALVTWFVMAYNSDMNRTFTIQDVPIVQIISDRYRLPVFFDHDNQSAVLAENLFGNGRGCNDILFVGIGDGVGCGILGDGQLFCNRRGLPPEMGHVSIDMKGRPCTCGSRGCVEMYLRTPELLKKMRYHTGKFYTYQAFCALEGDEMVERVFQDAVTRLASAVADSAGE